MAFPICLVICICCIAYTVNFFCGIRHTGNAGCKFFAFGIIVVPAAVNFSPAGVNRLNISLDNYIATGNF